MADLKLPLDIQKQMMEWIDGKKNMMIILGNPGLGKTHLCAALIKHCFFKPFRSLRFYQERDFLSKVRSSIELKGDYMDNMQYYADDELLILDDFGASGFNDWRKEIWQGFLDYRYQTEMPTVITTNLSREEIASTFHSRFGSRLFAKENLIIDFQGQDFRVNKQD